MSLFGLFSVNNLNKSLEKQYKNESEFVLKQTLASFEYEFSTIENILGQLGQCETLTRDHSSGNDEITALLQTYQQILPTNGNIIYGLDNGRFYQGISKKVPKGFNPAEQEWYKLAIKSQGEVIWTEPYLDYVTQKIIITAAKSVKGPNGIQSVIAIDFSLLEISNEISKSSIGEDGLVMLLSSNGTIIANRDNNMIGESLFGNQYSKMIQDTSKRYIPYVIQNKQYLLHSGRIEQNGMNIVTAISKEEISTSLIKSHLPVFIAGALCLLIFGIIAYVATLRGVRPLEKLGTLMGSVEKGNYDVHAKINDYKEIVRLANGFNSMIQGIKKRDEELLISNQEIKIAEEKLRCKYEELKESQRILKASEEKILHLASYDSLTGLLNRRSLLETLSKSLESNQKQSLKAVIFIDLDNFKTINDSLGHSFGDKVIIEVAKKLNSLSAVNKEVARISGDEFIIVIHDLESIGQAESMAKEILSQFDAPIKIESRILNVSSSIGVAIYPIHADTSEELLKLSDMAMYRAKESGKNGYRIFDEGIKQDAEEKLRIELGIRECLEKNEFELFFQPLYNPVEGRTTSIEALLRTNSAALSTFNILQIIQTAEVTGQIVEIDKWVLKQACIAIQKINHFVEQPVNISINVSAVHIMQQDFVDNIRQIIEESGVRPEWIELEITETSLMESFDINKKKLDEVRELGISFHLDDFGTGYSSLNYLTSLPIDRVKIDKSFVDAMLQSEKDSNIIKMIIKLAHNSGLQVVAEGVEQREQFELLKNYKCELIQGYYISKPVSFEEITSTIQKSI